MLNVAEERKAGFVRGLCHRTGNMAQRHHGSAHCSSFSLNEVDSLELAKARVDRDFNWALARAISTVAELDTKMVEKL